MNDNEMHYPNLHLLAVERTGWRRWLFGRWVYASEPFRRDIQRRCKQSNLKMMLKPWETITGEIAEPEAERDELKRQLAEAREEQKEKDAVLMESHGEFGSAKAIREQE